MVKHGETDPLCISLHHITAGEAGLLLKQQGVTITHVFTSVLQRAARALQDSLTDVVEKVDVDVVKRVDVGMCQNLGHEHP